MSSDRSIAEDRTLQCACGERFDVLEWQVIDVAARLDLVLELARASSVRICALPAASRIAG